MFLLQWGPAIVIMLVIFLLSATPSNELPNFGDRDFLIKKGAHMLGYALLTLGFLRGFSGSTGRLKLPAVYIFLAVILVGLYAMSDEYHQSFVPGRSSRLADVGIDSAGSIVAVIFWSIFPSVKKAIVYRLFPDVKLMNEEN
jgi:VanZ family protein